MMNSELVSVIIPTYNRAEFLKEAIESVMAQTYQNFELLILDNHSQDLTPEVVASFKDHRIKYLRHHCNIGPAANYAYGIYWAKGEYISILADDDMYKANFLAHRVKAMSLAPNIVAAFGPFEYWYQEQGIVKLSQALDIEQNSGNCYYPLHGVASLHAALNVQLMGASLYRASSVQGIWFRIMEISGRCGDELLNILLALDRNNRFVYINESDFIYRCNSQQDSRMNMLQVAEDGGRNYQYLVSLAECQQYSQAIKKKLVKHWNRNARLCWDLGNITYARNFFWRELKLNPFRFVTWLRLLRCFVVRPKPVQHKQS